MASRSRMAPARASGVASDPCAAAMRTMTSAYAAMTRLCSLAEPEAGRERHADHQRWNGEDGLHESMLTGGLGLSSTAAPGDRPDAAGRARLTLASRGRGFRFPQGRSTKIAPRSTWTG